MTNAENTTTETQSLTSALLELERNITEIKIDSDKCVFISNAISVDVDETTSYSNTSNSCNQLLVFHIGFENIVQYHNILSDYIFRIHKNIKTVAEEFYNIFDMTKEQRNAQ